MTELRSLEDFSSFVINYCRKAPVNNFSRFMSSVNQRKEENDVMRMRKWMISLNMTYGVKDHKVCTTYQQPHSVSPVGYSCTH